MSGTTLPYHMRQNKHVERHLFVDLLDHVNRWRPIAKYLYVGFGGVYFEDFKLLHSHFAMRKMLSLENQEWVRPRQELNVPYGCIDLSYVDSSSLVGNFQKLRKEYKVENVLCWLDYASSIQLASQLSELSALLPRLVANDVLKVTLPANPSVLGTKRAANNSELLSSRLEELQKRLLGTQFLAGGATIDQMTERRYPEVLCDSFQRVVAEAMKESPEMVFQPLGSYVYKDSTQMLTMTGIVLNSGDVDAFLNNSGLRDFELAGLSWELGHIEVPALRLREKLLLDQFVFKKDAKQVEAITHIQFDADHDESHKMVENYIKYYRYYPSYHRVFV